MELIDFNMEHLEDEEISMSWHLTPNDKKRIYEQLNNEENQKSIEKIKQHFLP